MSKVEVVNAMSKMGIDCRPFFHPLSSLPAYSASREAELARSRNGTAYHIASRGINLPSGFNMCRAKVHYVCQCLRDVLQESLRRH
jgi:perosamine synthetase